MAEYKDLEVLDGANETRVDAVWFEDQPPDSVNNAGRANEGMTARWYQDNNGTIISTGAGGVYTVSINSQVSTLYDGMTFSFVANHTSPGATSIIVNAPSPLPIRDLVNNEGNTISQGQIPAQSIVSVVYRGAEGRFRVVSDIKPGIGSVGPLEIENRAVEPRHEADGALGAIRVYDSAGRPDAVRGSNNQIMVRRSGQWVAEAMPNDEVQTFTISPLTTGQTNIDLNLSQDPDYISVRFRCLSPELGYATGDTIDISQQTYHMAEFTGAGSTVNNDRGGVTVVQDGQVLRIYVKDEVFIPHRFDSAGGTGNIDIINFGSWAIDIEGRVFGGNLPGGGGGGGSIDNSYAVVTDGLNNAAASGEDTLRFKSLDGSATFTVSAADNSVDLSVQSVADAASNTEPYVVFATPADLPNSQSFNATADNWITNKTTDDLAPSGTRLYVTPAEKSQWNAAEANLVDSVFALTGAVAIETLTDNPSPQLTDILVGQTPGGAHFKTEVGNITGGAVTAAYANMAGATGTAIAVGQDTFKIIGADNKVTTTAIDDDPTDGDVLTITINEANMLLQNMGGALGNDNQHGSRGGGGQHADRVPGGLSGFMTGADATKLNALNTSAQLGIGGAAGQVWVKNSAADYDAGWQDQLGLNAITKTGTVAADQIPIWTTNDPPAQTGSSSFRWTSSQFVTLNYTFGHDQVVGAAQANYVMMYKRDNGGPGVHEIVLEPMDLQFATGNLSVNRLNDGTNANQDTYWAGDGTWKTPPGAGGGEANTLASRGAGESLAGAQVGTELGVKSLIEGSNITITSTADEVTINSIGGGSPGITGTTAAPSSIAPGGRWTSPNITLTGAASATHSITEIHIPGGVLGWTYSQAITGADVGQVIIFNNTTSALNFSGNITVIARQVV